MKHLVENRRPREEADAGGRYEKEGMDWGCMICQLGGPLGSLGGRRGERGIKKNIFEKKTSPFFQYSTCSSLTARCSTSISKKKVWGIFSSSGSGGGGRRYLIIVIPYERTFYRCKKKNIYPDTLLSI